MKTPLPFLLLPLILCACQAATATPSAETTSPPTDTPLLPSPTSTAGATPLPSPPIAGGQWHYMFYHEPLQKLILVNGGPNQGKPSGDPLELWSWDGTQWTLLSADPRGPTWRNFAGAAYDPQRHVLVVHGGGQGSTKHFRETWEWDGETWALRAQGDSTPQSIDGLMAYDAARNQMILFGGSDGNTITNETWSWNGQQWTQLPGEGPAARFAGALVYDPEAQQVLLYGGHYAGPAEAQFFDDFWAWNGTQWDEIQMSEPNPGVRVVTDLEFDPETGQVLMFGGAEDVADIWAWDGTQWTRVPTTGMPARTGASLAYDPVTEMFVFFGGVDTPGGRGLSDTWQWDRDTWTCIDQCQ